MIRIVFFGTPPFAAEILRYLHANHVPILAVVTKIDKPKGRSLQVSESAVKQVAKELDPNLPILQPILASDENFIEQLKKFNADLFVVVAYGQILKQSLLDIPPMGCINVHASLLPKYRGAAPIQRAVMEGEEESGVAIQRMVKKLDAGDVITFSKTQITENMTAGELEKKLCELSKPLLLSTLQKFGEKAIKYTPQDESKVTFAPKLLPAEGEIHWSLSAQKIHNKIRAFSPKPGAWCWVEVQGKKRRLKIYQTLIVEESGDPGSFNEKSCAVFCSKNSLQLLEVQEEGKRKISGFDWLRGQRNLPKFCSENF